MCPGCRAEHLLIACATIGQHATVRRRLAPVEGVSACRIPLCPIHDSRLLCSVEPAMSDLSPVRFLCGNVTGVARFSQSCDARSGGNWKCCALRQQTISRALLDPCGCAQIIMASWNGGSPTPVFNNAAQVWNHTFFWEGMSPNGGGAPTGAVAEAIDKAFGSFDEFKAQFAAAGATQFGSGWAWLVANSDGTVEIEKTPNAVCPLVEGAPVPPYCIAPVLFRRYFSRDVLAPSSTRCLGQITRLGFV